MEGLPNAIVFLETDPKYHVPGFVGTTSSMPIDYFLDKKKDGVILDINDRLFGQKKKATDTRCRK